MSTYQKVIIVGNLGDDPKMHYFEGGGCIGRFPVATTESWTDKQSNEKKTKTEWHNIVVRNKQAEICEKYLSKGDKILIEGKISTRKWQDDAGNDRYSTEINANTFQFLTTKAEKEQRGGSTTTTSTKPEPHAGDDFLAGNTDKKEEEHDDLPF